MRRRLSAVLTAGFLLAGCSSAATDPGPVPTNDPDPLEATATDDPSAEVISPGQELSPDEVNGTGFAWQHPAGIYLTTTTGLPKGHLPGWTLDRATSDLLGTPVATDASGNRFVLTVDGVRSFDEALPLTGAEMSFGDDRIAVFADDSIVTELTFAKPDDVWVSSTGTVVGVLGGEAWDVENGIPIELDADCRLADRHPDGPAVIVCAQGSVLFNNGPSFGAPAGSTWGFAVTGLTGNEFLAQARYADGRREVHLGSSTATETRVIDAEAVLSYRQTGTAWVASFGEKGSLREVSADGTVEVLRKIPGVTDVAPMFR